MGQKHDNRRRGTKLTLDAFLRPSPPDSVPESLAATQSVSSETVRITRYPPTKSIAADADYTTDYPTPVEVHARKAFPGLCVECQMIFATWAEPHGICIPRHERKAAHHSLEDLKGCWCPICRMLLGSKSNDIEKTLRGLRPHADYTARSHVRVYVHGRRTLCYFIELVFVFGELSYCPFFMMFGVPGQSHSVGIPIPLHSGSETFADTGRDHRSTVATVQPSTDSKSAWKLANKWLQVCRRSHEACAIRHLTKTLPTRLLHVGSKNNELRLVLSESLPNNTHYATLSHCWGSKSFIKLTQENLKVFTKSIEFKHLTKTFRDAVIAARNLGFQYLWVSHTFFLYRIIQLSVVSAIFNNSKQVKSSHGLGLMSKRLPLDR